MSISPIDSKPSLAAINTSIQNALLSIYDNRDIAKVSLQSLADVIKGVGERIAQQKKGSFFRIHKDRNEKRFHGIERLSSICRQIKMLGFINQDRSVTIYLHLRKAKAPGTVEGATKIYQPEIRLDYNQGELSLARVEGQLTSRLEKNNPMYAYLLSLYQREKGYLKKFKDLPGVVNLYHSIKYDRVKFGNAITKIRMFVERYESDLFEFMNKQDILNTMASAISTEQEPPAAQDPQEAERLNVDVFEGCVDALDQIHRQVVVHGAVKSESYLINSHPLKIALCDLKYSRRLKQNKRVQTERVTLLYVSPENYKSMIKKKSDLPLLNNFASDIWALGCTLFKFLTGFHLPVSLFIETSLQLSQFTVEMRKNLRQMDQAKEVKKSRSEEKYVRPNLAVNPTVSTSKHLKQGKVLKKSKSDETALSPILVINPPILSSTDRASLKNLEWLGSKIVKKMAFLESVDVEEIGKLSDKGMLKRYDSFREEMFALMHQIEGRLFHKNFRLSHPEVIEHYRKVYKALEKLNNEFARIIKIGKEQHDWSMESDDFFITLIRKMVCSNPSERMSTGESLKLIREKFPASG